MSDRATEPIKEVLKQFEQTKAERDDKLDTIKAKIAEEIEALEEDNAVRVAVSENKKALGKSFKSLTKKLMRAQILEEGMRVDGRKLDEVRKITCRTGILPKRVHGTGLFRRGLTQVLSVTTLGTPGRRADDGRSPS